jgi:SagB-type dehydrogenase family enzyme
MDTTGTAIRAYLEALRDSEAGPVARSAAAPDRGKRYFGAARLTPAPGPAGELLRDLLGLVRVDWVHPADEQGLPVEEKPRLMVGRPAPSGGGLYPIEGYLAAGGPGLPAALFHYDLVHHALETLRPGDHRPALTALLAAPPPRPPDLVLVLSAVFWRSGAKYGDFAYRLQCQEIGVLAAQALALADKLNLSASLHLRFDDAAADRLLGLDSAAESVLAVLTFTRVVRRATAELSSPPAADDAAVSAGLSSLPAADDLALTPAARSTDPQPITGLLPHLAALHTATRTTAPAPEAPHADPPDDPEPTSTPGEPFPLPETAPLRLADGIPHRASTPAGYRPEPISARELAQILAAATGCTGDLPAPSPMITLHLLALRVAGVPMGSYRYDAGLHALARVAGEAVLAPVDGEPVLHGPLLPNTRVALRNAAAVLVPVGDPLGGVRWFGDRWYRIQQAGTGLVVHRATLAAAALGIASRIHSDGTTLATQAALGLTGSRRQALSFLLLGRPPIGPSLIRRLPAVAVDDAGSGDGMAPTPRVGAIHPPK